MSCLLGAAAALAVAFACEYLPGFLAKLILKGRARRALAGLRPALPPPPARLANCRCGKGPTAQGSETFFPISTRWHFDRQTEAQLGVYGEAYALFWKLLAKGTARDLERQRTQN